MRKSVRNLLPVVAVGAALAGAVIVPAAAAQAAPATSATPAFAHCAIRAPYDHDTSKWSDGYALSAARIRSGSSATCGTRDIISPGASGDELDYYCYTVGDDGYTWTYLRDNATGVEGWVRDDALNNYGANVTCEWS